jgi:hypothetical protein
VQPVSDPEPTTTTTTTPPPPADIEFEITAPNLAYGTYVTVSGVVAPRLRTSWVRLQRMSAGKWVTLTGALPLSDGSFLMRSRRWGPGPWRLLAGSVVVQFDDDRILVVSPPPPPPPSSTSTTTPPPSGGGLPPRSGQGRRVIYSIGRQRVWAVDAAGNVVKTHRVSGRRGSPGYGTYRVYSRSMHTYSPANPNIRWTHMVRFARTARGSNIGFHSIPRNRGVPVQSEAQLGIPLSGGCVRQSMADAEWMWGFAGLGTVVVVVP